MLGGEDWVAGDVLQIGNDYLCISIFSKLINELSGYLFVTQFAMTFPLFPNYNTNVISQ